MQTSGAREMQGFGTHLCNTIPRAHGLCWVGRNPPETDKHLSQWECFFRPILTAGGPPALLLGPEWAWLTCRMFIARLTWRWSVLPWRPWLSHVRLACKFLLHVEDCVPVEDHSRWVSFLGIRLPVGITGFCGLFHPNSLAARMPSPGAPLWAPQ